MKILIGIILCIFIIIQIATAFFNWPLFSSRQEPIKVGLVYSSTGFRSIREQPFQQAALLAIDEINQKGGLLGRELQPVIRNAGSSWERTQTAIEELILDEKVNVIFGCWTKDARHTTKKIFEKYHHLLISPYQYEGLFNHSSSILNIGTSTNQQIMPIICYCFHHVGPRFFLVGSDYMFSYITNTMIEDHVKALDGEIIGVENVPIGSEQMDHVIQHIIETKPDVIINSMISLDNKLFFKKLKEAGITAKDIPVFSLTLTEAVLKQVDIEDVIGHYAAWNYFQSIDSTANEEFIEKFKQFSSLNVVDNTAEASYIGVLLWAKAVTEAQATDHYQLDYSLNDMRLKAPEGLIMMDMDGRRAWKYARIGKIKPDGQFDIVWQSSSLIRPIPIQVFRSTFEWNELINHFYQQLNDQANTFSHQGS